MTSHMKNYSDNKKLYLLHLIITLQEQDHQLQWFNKANCRKKENQEDLQDEKY